MMWSQRQQQSQDDFYSNLTAAAPEVQEAISHGEIDEASAAAATTSGGMYNGMHSAGINATVEAAGDTRATVSKKMTSPALNVNNPPSVAEVKPPLRLSWKESDRSMEIPASYSKRTPMDKEVGGINTWIKCVVTSWNNPREIFVQEVKDARKAHQLRDEMNRVYNVEPRFSETDVESFTCDSPPSVNECLIYEDRVLSAKWSSGDAFWYRGQVKSVDLTNQTAEILFIDYGNAESVSMNDLRPLHDKFASISPMAMRCALKAFEDRDEFLPEECAALSTNIEAFSGLREYYVKFGKMSNGLVVEPYLIQIATKPDNVLPGIQNIDNLVDIGALLIVSQSSSRPDQSAIVRTSHSPLQSRTNQSSASVTPPTPPIVQNGAENGVPALQTVKQRRAHSPLDRENTGRTIDRRQLSPTERQNTDRPNSARRQPLGALNSQKMIEVTNGQGSLASGDSVTQRARHWMEHTRNTNGTIFEVKEKVGRILCSGLEKTVFFDLNTLVNGVPIEITDLRLVVSAGLTVDVVYIGRGPGLHYCTGITISERNKDAVDTCAEKTGVFLNVHGNCLVSGKNMCVLVEGQECSIRYCTE